MRIDAVDYGTIELLGAKASLEQFLDQPIRQAISRAIFFVGEKSTAPVQRRFLRPLCGEAALNAAIADRPAGRVSVDEPAVEAIFTATDAWIQKISATAGDVEKFATAAMDQLKEMELPPSAMSAVSAVVRCFVPNLLPLCKAGEAIEFAVQKRGNQAAIAFRTPGLAASRRAGKGVSPEDAARLAEADFGNVLNLGWFSTISISQSGDSVVLLSK